jgi:hypothetical protein
VPPRHSVRWQDAFSEPGLRSSRLTISRNRRSGPRAPARIDLQAAGFVL